VEVYLQNASIIFTAMNQFQKNVLFIGATLLAIVAICFGINFAIQTHTRALQEQARLLDERKTAWKKDNIRALKSLSGIGALSTEEQIRVDNAGDDLERLQQVLLDIHQERCNYWESSLEDVADRQRKLENITREVGYTDDSQITDIARTISEQETKARSNLIGFRAAMAKIHDWRPSKFEDYRPDRAEVAPSDKPSAATSLTNNRQIQVPIAQSDLSTPAPPLTPVSTSTESSSEAALDGVDLQISQALKVWAKAMESNDPNAEAQCYADQVDRYFLRLNVTNSFVRDDKDTWLKTHDDRITRFVTREVTFENETATTAKLRLVKDVVTSNSFGNTERLTHSRLYLRKIDGEWKITSEQDFK
jgi:hypothetical protein